MDTKTARLPIDIIEAAERAGRTQHRSAAKQLEHWARFGMFFDGQTTAASQRIRSAVSGELSLSELSDDEAVVANATISATISQVSNNTSFADRLAKQGVTTVVMDDDGQMIRRHPDGTTTTL